MSNIKSFDDAPYLYPPTRQRSAIAGAVAGLRVYWQALRDGLAAARRYNELTARGVAHERAVQEIFDEHFDAR